MVIGPWSRTARRISGVLTMELVVALGILATVMIPLGFSFLYEQKLCRAYYHRAIAMELIDGELEALVAGEWRVHQPGEQDYAMPGEAARNLPPGRFLLTVTEHALRLEWQPQKRGRGGTVTREVRFVPEIPAEEHP